jgi:iron complex outermembrane receptor protein
MHKKSYIITILYRISCLLLLILLEFGFSKKILAAGVPQSEVSVVNADEILVTARRRSESVQRVPIALSVLGGEALDARGVFNVARLTQLQPSLQFYSTNPRNTVINIRGLGAPFGFTNEGIEQGVGIYIDQVYNSRIASSTLDLVDIAQIEVLRGPQGMLYGKNTTAGAINITIRQPSFTPEAHGEASMGNFGFRQLKAAVSGPISERLAVRVSGTMTDRRGTLFNVATGRDVNALDNLGLRGVLRWEPRAELKLTLSADYNIQDPNCCAQVFARLATTQRPANRQYAALVARFPGYAVPSTNPFDRLTDLDAPTRARNMQGGVSLLVEWETGAGTLTSVSAWRRWTFDPANDRDFTGLQIYTKVNNPYAQNQFTQELRYALERERFDVVAGAFGFRQGIGGVGIQETGPAGSAWLLPPSNPLSDNPAVLNGLTAINDIWLDNSSAALFGKLNWKLGSRLTVSPGLRLNFDRKRGRYSAIVTGTASDGTRQPVSNVPADPYFHDPWIAAQRSQQATQVFEVPVSGWNLSWDLNVAWRLDEDVNVYANYARAFKTEGVNLNGVPSLADGTPALDVAVIRPERINHYEAGVKSQWLDRRLTVNLAAFWTDIDDFQANVISNISGSNVLRGYLANADKARSRGVEADVSARVGERLNLYANGALTDSRFVRFSNAPCPPELAGGGSGMPVGPPATPGVNSPPNCDVSGAVMPGVSRWAFSWGAEQRWPLALGARAGEVYLGYDGNYRSRFSSNASPSRFTVIEGHSVHNLRAGLRSGRVDAFFWVRNVLAQDFFEFLTVGPGNTGLITGQPGEPRMWGGTLKIGT